jgi:transglutaminase-like putative cysteine protease
MPDQPTESATIRTLLVIPVEVAGRLAVSVAAADLGASTETLTLTASDGSAVPHREVTLDRGMRLHVIDAPEGEVTLTYDATVALTAAEPEQVSDADSFTYILPSRYCPSDRLTGLANTEFGHIEADAVRARRIVSWVHERLSYVQGTTTATDDALTPLLGGLGVCRDYAHLVVALARAVGMPARYVSVYAPGLSPMDAHAVVEIGVDGKWFVFDATRLAPRKSMVRIGTGRDAADVAVLSSLGGANGPTYFEVTATASPVLPVEDPEELVTLG